MRIKFIVFLNLPQGIECIIRYEIVKLSEEAFLPRGEPNPAWLNLSSPIELPGPRTGHLNII